MECEKCQDQVLELIEREAIDPGAVHAILDACPECRAEFERLKSTLALADALPRERPSEEVDATILRLAEERRELTSEATVETEEDAVIPYDRRRFRRLPWAFAAVAVLGVGLGYLQASNWGQIGGTELAVEGKDEAAAEPTAVPAPAPRTDQAQAQGSAGREQAQAPARKSVSSYAKQGVHPEVAEAVESNLDAGRLAQKEARRRKPAQRIASEAPASSRDGALGRPAAAAPMAEEANVGSFAVGAVAADEASDDTREANRGADREAENEAADDAPVDQASKCRATLVRFEAKRTANDSYAPTPKEQLEAGLCYLETGQRMRARTWLERATAHPETRTQAKAALQKL